MKSFVLAWVVLIAVGIAWLKGRAAGKAACGRGDGHLPGTRVVRIARGHDDLASGVHGHQGGQACRVQGAGQVAVEHIHFTGSIQQPGSGSNGPAGFVMAG